MGFVNYDFLDDAGVPQQYKDKLKQLHTEMDDLLSLQRQQVVDAKQHIATLDSWVGVAEQAISIIQSIVPLIPTISTLQPVAGGTGATANQKQKFLQKLASAGLNLYEFQNLLGQVKI